MTPHQSPERRRRVPSLPAASTSTPAPVEGASKLPMELIFGILSRVPVRSVCRFRRVSKGWRALLHDPIFVAAHKSLNAETFIVVSPSQKLPGGGRELWLMDMDGNDVGVKKGINCTGLRSASMDDLVCVCDESHNGAWVINPATGKVLVVCPKRDVRSWEAWGMVFAFGRAMPSGTYKVLRYLSGQGCEVFSLGDATGWRLSECPPANLPRDPRSVVAVKGVMYFLVVGKQYSYTLLCFDIEREKWTKAIQSPQKVVACGTSTGTIAELNDTVCMVVLQLKGPMSSYHCVNIWLLKDSHEDIWIKAYTIPTDAFTSNYTPLRVTRDGGKLIFYCTVYRTGQALIKVYDPNTDRSTTLRRLDDVADGISLCSLLGPPL